MVAPMKENGVNNTCESHAPTHGGQKELREQLKRSGMVEKDGGEDNAFNLPIKEYGLRTKLLILLSVKEKLKVTWINGLSQNKNWDDHISYY